jgi:hypothetical protein
VHAEGVRSCPGDPAQPPLASRRGLYALATASLALAVGVALLVRSVFTGVFLETPATPSPPAATAGPPSPVPPVPPAPVGGVETLPAPLPSEEQARSVRRDADLDVPERLAARAREVRQSRRRYRELERELGALGGPTSPAAQETLAEMEQLARELRQAEADLDRARRRRGG